ncbi:MAG: hypothetical protein H6860_05275 [Rhodospirillales bacterium]|nr:hypothetical protein [Alphaproteobacteria bacterium]MCB9981793.1 hypothetical protein [Rhodospirillales bacterium]
MSRAQEISETGAQHLQTILQNILDTRQQQRSAQDKSAFEFDGAITVEPAGTYYAITWPQMKLHSANGDTLKIGLIAMNAVPHDKPGQYKITTAIPIPIIGQNEDGQEILHITIGAQNAAGIFDESLNNFIKMNAQLNDIQIIFDGGEALATIPKLQLSYNLSEDDNARWSGPSHFEISDLKLTRPGESAALSIKKLVVSSRIASFAAQALNGGMQHDEQNQLSPLQLSDGAEITLAISGLSVSGPNSPEKNENFTLESAAFNFKYENALSGSTKAHTSLSFQNLITNDIPQELQMLLPRTGSFSLTQHNIPLAEIDETLQNSAEASGKILSLPLLFKIPSILAQAGSYLEIRETFFENPEYRIDFDSILRADLAAVNSATAIGTLRFAGLDKILSRAQVIGTDINSSPYALPVRELARFLERLKPLGRIETTAENGFIHIFDLKMDEKGQFLINGQNTDTLLQEPKEPTPPAQQKVLP